MKSFFKKQIVIVMGVVLVVSILAQYKMHNIEPLVTAVCTNCGYQEIKWNKNSNIFSVIKNNSTHWIGAISDYKFSGTFEVDNPENPMIFAPDESQIQVSKGGKLLCQFPVNLMSQLFVALERKNILVVESGGTGYHILQFSLEDCRQIGDTIKAYVPNTIVSGYVVVMDGSDRFNLWCEKKSIDKYYCANTQTWRLENDGQLHLVNKGVEKWGPCFGIPEGNCRE